MSLLKKAMRRRKDDTTTMKSNHQRSRSQERALDNNEEQDYFEKLEKRYLSYSCSSTDSSTEDESPMTAPLTERKHFFANDDSLPTTIPRFPVSETHDKHCWSEPGHDIYTVRGPHYLQDDQKVESGPYLLRARGCDLLLASDGSPPPEHVGRYVESLYSVFCVKDAYSSLEM